MEPVFVLGYGRSGTTWVSDIISRTLGGVLLFEPIHPQANRPIAEKYAFAALPAGAPAPDLASYFGALFAGEFAEPWLLRNHLPHALHLIDPGFIRQVVDEVRGHRAVLGFKEIRFNLMVDWLATAYPRGKIVYLVRHPYAVISSILRRNFWEFGSFRGVFNRWNENGGHGFEPLAADPDHDRQLELMGVMWGTTHRIAQEQVRRQGIPVWRYEDLYSDPFEQVRALLAYLGYTSFIHPALIFTPSVTNGNRTLHGYKDRTIDLRQFWTSSFTSAHLKIIKRAIESTHADLYEL
jgi:hypothetical protein